MKLRKILFISLFLLIGSDFISAQIKLSFNPKKGTRYEYQSEMLQTFKQTINEREIPVEMEMIMKYQMDVKEKNAQDTKTQYTYKDITSIISSPMLKMGYESKKPVENPSDMDKILEKIFGAFIDKSFEVTIASDGSVKDVTGMEAIVEEITNAVSDKQSQVGASMKQQFSDAAIKNSFEQSLKMYPADAVKVGDSWEIEHMISLSGMNTTTKAKYTLKEVKKKIATIVMEATINITSVTGMDGAISGVLTGTTMMDVKTGMPIVSETLLKASGPVKFKEMEILMDISSKMKVTTKKIKGKK